MPAVTPEERVLSARIAATTRWAHTPDRSAATAPARAGLRAKFAREIDPDGTLPADELEKRIDLLVSAHMARMSLRAARARRRVREQATEAERAEAELAEFIGDGDAA